MKKTTVLNLFFATALLGSGLAIADDVTTTPVQNQTQTRQKTGQEMMTAEERDAQREKMRNANSTEEREQIKAAQHEKMQQRAAELGQSINESARPNGGQSGMGRGNGGGQGSGQGGGGGMGGGRGGR